MAQVGIYNSTPNSSGGGIWQGGTAPAVDAGGTNNVYFAVGNRLDQSGPMQDSQSIIGLSSTATGVLNPVFRYTVPNAINLSNADLDVGSNGPILPSNGSLIQLDKAGNAYQLSLSTQQAMQLPFVAIPAAGDGSVAYNEGAYANGKFYIWGMSDKLKEFNVSSTTKLLATSPAATGSVTAPGFIPAGGISISSKSGANGIVWSTLQTPGSTPNPETNTVPGTLYAFNATSLGNPLWTSDQARGNYDTLGTLAKWVPPTVMNGKVYVATFDNQLQVYGPPPVFWGQNYNYQFNPTGSDWAANSYKGECYYSKLPAGTGYAFEVMTGLSEYPGGVSGQQQAHQVLCSGPVQNIATASSHCVAEPFNSSLPANPSYDWDSGYLKAECPANYAAVGISQSTSGHLTSLLCCATGSTFSTSASNCTGETLFNQNSQDFQYPDWDIGYYKAQCPEGYFMTGASEITSSTQGPVGAPHTALCCLP
jgi:hypothetical protein